RLTWATPSTVRRIKASSYPNAPIPPVTGPTFWIGDTEASPRRKACPPFSRNTRCCWIASTPQPQANLLPRNATGCPSIIVVGSPSTIGNVPLCCGHVALSLTRATGLPSISVNGEPETTLPPLLVLSPCTTHILLMLASLPSDA